MRFCDAASHSTELLANDRQFTALTCYNSNNNLAHVTDDIALHIQFSKEIKYGL